MTQPTAEPTEPTEETEEAPAEESGYGTGNPAVVPETEDESEGTEEEASEEDA